MKKSKKIFLYSTLAVITPLSIGSLALSCACNGEKSNAFAQNYIIENNSFFNKETGTLDLSKEKITAIPDGAFAKRTLELFKTSKEIRVIDFEKTPIKHIILPETLTSIGKAAFESLGLESITFSNPTDVEVTIDKKAFYDNKLKSIDFGERKFILKDLAFAENELTSVTLNVSINSLAYGVFSGNKLTTIDLTHVKSINSLALAGNKIAKLTLPAELIASNFDFLDKQKLSSPETKVNLTINNATLKETFKKELQTNPDKYNWTITE